MHFGSIYNYILHMGPTRPGNCPRATHKRKASSLKVQGRKAGAVLMTKKLKLGVAFAERSLNGTEPSFTRKS